MLTVITVIAIATVQPIVVEFRAQERQSVSNIYENCWVTTGDHMMIDPIVPKLHDKLLIREWHNISNASPTICQYNRQKVPP